MLVAVGRKVEGEVVSGDGWGRCHPNLFPEIYLGLVP